MDGFELLKKFGFDAATHAPGLLPNKPTSTLLMRTCIACKETKPITEYPMNANGGRHPYCRVCDKKLDYAKKQRLLHKA